jgi:glycosyltransferase involved in cell wall biosynthesis
VEKEKKINVLIATGIFPPEIGGPATYSRFLKEELPKRNIGVGIITYGPAGISRKMPPIIRHLAYFFSCFFRSFKYDMIFAQDVFSAAFPALIAAKLSGRKIMVRVAGDFAWEKSAQYFGVKENIDDFQKRKYGWKIEWFRCVQRFIVNHADLVITPSYYFGKLVSQWMKKPEKLKVIYNGLKLNNNPDASVGSFKKVIFSAGRLVNWKGYDVLIKAIKELPDWQLIIAGEGPERDKLADLSKSLDVDDRVKFLGAISRKEMDEYFSQVGIFVLNTSFESFSFQVVEAMNAGVPVITTNIGNLPEIIVDGQQGVLVDCNNQEQIIAAIKKISENDSFREMIIKNAKAKSLIFSIDNHLDKLIAAMRIIIYEK